MALVIDDRIRETSTTTGTGTYTLAGAVTGFQSFAAVGNGNTTWYCATNSIDWEVGIGTYTAAGTTLARTTVISSSNADAAVNWSAGTRDIFCTIPASIAALIAAAATQAEQETGTGITQFVSPGRQQFHASAAKLWLRATANSTTIEASYNITSVADTATGSMTVTTATDFSSADYAVNVTIDDTGTTQAQSAIGTTLAAGTFVMNSVVEGGGLSDPVAWMASGFGDQA